MKPFVKIIRSHIEKGNPWNGDQKKWHNMQFVVITHSELRWPCLRWSRPSLGSSPAWLLGRFDPDKRHTDPFPWCLARSRQRSQFGYCVEILRNWVSFRAKHFSSFTPGEKPWLYKQSCHWAKQRELCGLFWKAHPKVGTCHAHRAIPISRCLHSQESHRICSKCEETRAHLQRYRLTHANT